MVRCEDGRPMNELQLRHRLFDCKQHLRWESVGSRAQ